MSSNNEARQANYEKGNISPLVTNLLQSDMTRGELVKEAEELLSWVKSVYPEDYEIYVNRKFDGINEENVIKVLKNVVTMCTYNSL